MKNIFGYKKSNSRQSENIPPRVSPVSLEEMREKKMMAILWAIMDDTSHPPHGSLSAQGSFLSMARSSRAQLQYVFHLCCYKIYTSSSLFSVDHNNPQKISCNHIFLKLLIYVHCYYAQAYMLLCHSFKLGLLHIVYLMSSVIYEHFPPWDESGSVADVY